MSEDTAFWQGFHKEASELHARLYYGKASRSYDLQRQEWVSPDEVLQEGDNLSKAARFLESEGDLEAAQDLFLVSAEMDVYWARHHSQRARRYSQGMEEALQEARNLKQGFDQSIEQVMEQGVKVLLDVSDILGIDAPENMEELPGLMEIAGVPEERSEGAWLNKEVIVWQSFYQEATERHAHLYYEKARQSYDSQENEWISVDDVLYEGENLTRAADCFRSQGKLTLVREILSVAMALDAYKMRLSVQEMHSGAQDMMAARQEVETQGSDVHEALDEVIDTAKRLTLERLRSYYGDVGITEDVDESRKGWTAEDRDKYLELRSSLYNIEDPMSLSLELIYSPAQYSPPIDGWRQHDVIDRQQETQCLLATLERTKRIGVSGPFGIGKTTLVAQLWHDKRATTIFPDGMFWIRSPRVRPKDITDMMAIALHKPVLRVRPLDEQIAEIGRALEGKKSLIVLDEAVSADEVATTVGCVPPSCTLLVTSSRVRCFQPLKGELLLMKPLEPQDAVALFRAWRGERTCYYVSRVDWEICQSLAYLPLALEVVGRYIAWSHVTPQQVLSELRFLQRRFADEDNVAVRTSLALCVDGLPDNLAGLLGMLCMVPALHVDLDAIDAVSNMDVQTCLPDLLDLGLVRFEKALGYYPLPSLLDLVQVRSLQRGRTSNDDMWTRLSSFLQTYLAANAQDFDRLERVRMLISWMIECQFRQGASAQTISSIRLMIPFLMAGGYWADLAKALKTVIHSASLLGDPTALAHFRHQLALLYYHSQQDEEALRLLRENVDSLQALEDWITLSLALYAMATLYERTGGFSSARAVYQQVLDLPIQDSSTYVHAAYRLGEMEFQSNDFQAARRAFQAAYDAVGQLSS